MPLKGFGEHNLQNWRSQVSIIIFGCFLLALEVSVAILHQTRLQDTKDNIDAKVVIAGLSTTCSQKIHNQLAASRIIEPNSRMRRTQSIIQTGYLLICPLGSLGSYCIYEYHMPCSMDLQLEGKLSFMGRLHDDAEDFRKDLYGIVSGLQDGGYSDDMTLAAIVGNTKGLYLHHLLLCFLIPLQVILASQ
ncbi:hypothetical protein ACMD2_22785, partial [Ananas comosus]